MCDHWLVDIVVQVLPRGELQHREPQGPLHSDCPTLQLQSPAGKGPSHIGRDTQS